MVNTIRAIFCETSEHPEAYIEINQYIDEAATYTITRMGSLGWQLYKIATTGSQPSGYTSYTYSITSNSINIGSVGFSNPNTGAAQDYTTLSNTGVQMRLGGGSTIMNLTAKGLSTGVPGNPITFETHSMSGSTKVTGKSTFSGYSMNLVNGLISGNSSSPSGGATLNLGKSGEYTNISVTANSLSFMPDTVDKLDATLNGNPIATVEEGTFDLVQENTTDVLLSGKYFKIGKFVFMRGTGSKTIPKNVNIGLPFSKMGGGEPSGIYISIYSSQANYSNISDNVYRMNNATSFMLKNDVTCSSTTVYFTAMYLTND